MGWRGSVDFEVWERGRGKMGYFCGWGHKPIESRLGRVDVEIKTV